MKVTRRPTLFYRPPFYRRPSNLYRLLCPGSSYHFRRVVVFQVGNRHSPQSLRAHSHRHPHDQFVAAGRASLLRGRETGRSQLGPGRRFCIPAGHPGGPERRQDLGGVGSHPGLFLPPAIERFRPAGPADGCAGVGRPGRCAGSRGQQSAGHPRLRPRLERRPLPGRLEGWRHDRRGFPLRSRAGGLQRHFAGQ